MNFLKNKIIFYIAQQIKLYLNVFFSLDLQRLLTHPESEVFRKRRPKVLTNLHARRDAEAKLLAREISEEDFLVAMSYQNEPQILALQTKFRLNPQSAMDPASEDLSQDSPDEQLCIVCVNVKQGIHALFPCAHAFACRSCCEKLFQMKPNQQPLCPTCRQPVESYQTIQV